MKYSSFVNILAAFFILVGPTPGHAVYPKPLQDSLDICVDQFKSIIDGLGNSKFETMFYRRCVEKAVVFEKYYLGSLDRRDLIAPLVRSQAAADRVREQLLTAYRSANVSDERKAALAREIQALNQKYPGAVRTGSADSASST